jgi:hypothetical protein
MSENQENTNIFRGLFKNKIRLVKQLSWLAKMKFSQKAFPRFLVDCWQKSVSARVRATRAVNRKKPKVFATRARGFAKYFGVTDSGWSGRRAIYEYSRRTSEHDGQGENCWWGFYSASMTNEAGCITPSINPLARSLLLLLLVQESDVNVRRLWKTAGGAREAERVGRPARSGRRMEIGPSHVKRTQPHYISVVLFPHLPHRREAPDLCIFHLWPHSPTERFHFQL